MNVLKASLLATALFASGIATSAQAAEASTDFDVTITITAICDITTVAATDVNFGSVASSAVNTDNAGSLTVNCTPGTAYNIALNEGGNGTTANDRAMGNGTDLVPYQLYRQAARGAGDIWGETIGTDTMAGTGTGATQAYPVFGRVPSANFPAGTYNDVVTATVIY